MVENKILNKIKGLFAQAASVAGTPEADVFTAKAYELLAKYGVDEAMARGAGNTGNGDGDVMKASKFLWPDRFGFEKILLVNAIAKALHCDCVQLREEFGIQVFGLARHIDRVKFLVELTMPQMLTGASRAIPNNPFAGRNPQDSSRITAGHRADWMVGFADKIGERLVIKEREAANAYDKAHGGSTAAVAMMTDADRARAAMRKRYPNMGSGSRRRVGGAGYAGGSAAGANADVGNTRVGGGKVAIG